MKKETATANAAKFVFEYLPAANKPKGLPATKFINAISNVLARAYETFARNYPDFISFVFDENGMQPVVSELVKMFSREDESNPSLIADAWGKQISPTMSKTSSTDLEKAATALLEVIRRELISEPLTQSLIEPDPLVRLAYNTAEILKQAEERKQHHIDIERGQSLLRTGNYKSAIDEFNRVLASDPTNIYAAQMRQEALSLEETTNKEEGTMNTRYYSMGLPSHGEDRVVYYLNEHLADSQYTIFRNAQITDNSGRSFEFDSIIVGDGIIYLLEVKHYSGKITGDGSQWRIRNGMTVPNPINQTKYKARLLAEKLRDYSPILGKVFVEPLIVLVGEDVQIELNENQFNQVVRLADLPRIIREHHRLSIEIDSIQEFSNVVKKALFDTVNLKLYISGTEEIDKPLTPDYLEIIVAPYLKALESLLQIINEIKGKPLDVIAIEGITKRSPLSVNLDAGAGEAIRAIQETVVPWRRKNAKEMKEIELELKKAEVVQTRIRTAKEREESKKISVEAKREQAEIERINLENEERRLALEEKRFEFEKKRIGLALELLNRLKVDMTEAEKIAYVVRLLEPLKVLTASEISPAAE